MRIEIRDRSILGRLTRNRVQIPEDGSTCDLRRSIWIYHDETTHDKRGLMTGGSAFKRPDGSVEAFIAIIMAKGDEWGRPVFDEPRGKTLTITPEQHKEGVRLPYPFENFEVKAVGEGAFSRFRRKLGRRIQD